MNIVQEVLLVHAQFVQSYYHARWVPKDENIKETLDLLKSPLPGFEPYTKKDMLERLQAFHKCRETWLVSCKHNYSVFIKHFHRWLPPIPAKQPPSFTSSPTREDVSGGFCDCRRQLRKGEICPDCYPQCDKCKRQHLRSESCKEFLERDQKVRQMFLESTHRDDGNPTTIAGVKAFDDKTMKTIREERH